MHSHALLSRKDRRHAMQSNRMDTREDYVEVYDDEKGRKDKRTWKTQKLRRYKDDTYR